MKKHLARTIFAILGAALVLLPLLSGGGTQLYEMRWRYATDENGKFELCFFTTEGEVCRLPAESGAVERTLHDFSIDRRYAAALSAWERRTGGDLYRVASDGADFIADRVFHALISDDGGTLVYIQAENGYGETGRLYLYRHASGRTVCLDESVSLDLTARYAISPDGGTVAWCRAGDEGFTGVVWNDGEYHELGRGVIPVAVADGMEHIYYAEPESDSKLYRLYVKSGDRAEFLVVCAFEIYVQFNRDFSEVYAARKAGEYRREVIAAGADNVVVLGYGLEQLVEPYVSLREEYQYDPFGKDAAAYIRHDIESFRGQRFSLEEDGAAFGVINDDLSVSPITGKAVTNSLPCQFSAENNTGLVCTKQRLYFIDGTDSDGVLISADVKDFAASGDLSEVYYISSTGELYYQTLPDGEAKLIDKNAYLPQLIPYDPLVAVPSWTTRYTAPGILLDGTLYYISHNSRTLNAVSHGGEPRELLSSVNGLNFTLIGTELFIIEGLSTAPSYYLLEGDTPVLIGSDSHPRWYMGA